jgi:hypothetical protein
VGTKLFYVNYAKFFLAGLILIVLSTSSHAFPYKGLDIDITTGIAGSYDDNLTFSSDDKKGDFVTTLTLGIKAAYRSRRRSLSVGAFLNERFNATYSDIRNSNQRINVSFSNHFTEYDRVSLDYNITHSYSPQSFEEALGRISARRESYYHNFSLLYSRDIIEGFFLNASYRFSQSLFTEENVDDTYTNGFSISMNYTPVQEITYSLAYNYSISNTDNWSQSGTFGIKRYITERIHLNGRAGLSNNSSSSDPNLNTYFDVTGEMSEVSRWQLYVSRRDQFAAETGAVTNTWRAAGSYTRQLSGRLEGSAQIYYGKARYEEVDIVDTVTGAHVNLNYQIAEDFNGNLSYTFANLDSDLEERGYTKNIIKLGVTKRF